MSPPTLLSTLAVPLDSPPSYYLLTSRRSETFPLMLLLVIIIRSVIIFQVVGIDYCGRFLDTAMKIQKGKVVEYGSRQVAKLPSQSLPSRVQFKQVRR